VAENNVIATKGIITMDTTALLSHIKRLDQAVTSAGNNHYTVLGVHAQIEEFLHEYSGPKSSFSEMVKSPPRTTSELAYLLHGVLRSFSEYIEAGLLGAVSPVRKAQLDVVSDFLEQAQLLLNANGVHPAAPIVLIGATLEEFLRTWIESKELSLEGKKASLDAYAQVLMSEGLITKQDIKDITAWGGLRNHAAHGEWDQVSDKQRASIMLDGVNLFMRKYGA
jgi:hypothetical protein